MIRSSYRGQIIVCCPLITKKMVFLSPYNTHSLTRSLSEIGNLRVPMFHRAFFNSIIDKHQHMHFFTFNTVLV